MVSLINISLAFLVSFLLVSCHSVLPSDEESVTRSSIDNRLIDDLSVSSDSDVSIELNENLKDDLVFEEYLSKPAYESSTNATNSDDVNAGSVDVTSNIENVPMAGPHDSVEYSGGQRNGKTQLDVRSVTSETEKQPHSVITQLVLLKNEEHLRLLFDGKGIHEYVQFEVPEGKVLSALFLTSYYGEDDVAFYGIKAGCCEEWTAEPNIIPYLEAWSHIGPMNLYSNILSYSKNIQNTNTLPEAVMNTSREYRVLTPGIYVLLVQNANISGARYDFLFKLR